jgi:hypothetical protein
MCNATHYAFSDESKHNTGRFRSIGMISFPSNQMGNIENEFLKICSEYNITNFKHFKWKQLKNDRKRNATKSILKFIIDKAFLRKLRIDILIWDIEDSRHKIVGRDDSENLARMYYHLYKDVFLKRWQKNSFWKIYPDSNTAIDWEIHREIIMNKSLKARKMEPINGLSEIILENTVTLKIEPSNPQEHPLIQVADLFAGMGAYSWEEYNKFEEWSLQKVGQSRLINNNISLSNADNHKCTIMNSCKSQCKKYRLRTSLNSTRGFKTHVQSDPINFWLWNPQSDLDKAPLKNK